jgi:hypothetical protein
MRGWGKPLLPKACRLLWLINFAVVGEIFRMRLAAAAEPSSIMIYLFCRHNMRSIYWHQKRLMDMFTLSLATTAARMFVFEPLSSSDIEWDDRKKSLATVGWRVGLTTAFPPPAYLPARPPACIHNSPRGDNILAGRAGGLLQYWPRHYRRKDPKDIDQSMRLIVQKEREQFIIPRYEREEEEESPTCTFFHRRRSGNGYENRRRIEEEFSNCSLSV